MGYSWEPGELRGRPLTEREETVLVEVVNGGGYKPASRRLGITADRVHNILGAIRDKLGARTTAQAAVLLYPRLGYRYLETPERRRLFDVAMQLVRERAA